MITESQMDFIVRRWNLCESNKRIRLAVEYFRLKRSNHQETLSWWQFLEKRLSA